jgi:arylsulfatase
VLGEQADLILRTVGEEPKIGNEFRPSWRSLYILSDGIRVRLAKWPQRVVRVTDDLLSRFDSSRVQANEKQVVIERVADATAPDRPRDAAVPAVEIVPSFNAGPWRGIARGGAWPALAFATSASLRLQPVAIERGAKLTLSLGLEGFLESLNDPVGAATFRVHAGEKLLLEQRVSGQDGWFDPEPIALDAFAGERIEIGIEVRLEPAKPQQAQRTSDQPPFELRVRRAAVGRPRIVVASEVPRRLSGEGQPNVIVLCSETLRADHLGCYGSTRGLTPELDALSKRAISYSRAYSASSWTLPSTASLLTGLDPVVHGVVDESRHYLKDENVTLGEAAQALGVTTAAFVANEFICREKNFDQGCETFAMRAYANARALNELFFHWLADHRDVQFFAYLHYWDPHDPCNAPGALERKYVPDALASIDHDTAAGKVKAALSRLAAPPLDATQMAAIKDDVDVLHGLYCGEIAYLDRQVGDLMRRLEAMGLLKKTYVIFTSDHGEEFLEHGFYGHGSFLHEELVHVPLMILGPGVQPQIVDQPVENLRVYQTALALLGDRRKDWGENGPLPPFGDPGRPYAFLSTWKGLATINPVIELRQEFAVVGANEKLILEAQTKNVPERLILYDLGTDPGETRSLVPPAKSKLEEELRQWIRYGIQHSRVGPAAPLTEDELRVLRALGYTGVVGGTKAKSDTPNN